MLTLFAGTEKNGSYAYGRSKEVRREENESLQVLQSTRVR